MIGENFFVDNLLDLRDFLSRELGIMGKVKTCLIRINQRPALLYMTAQHLAQCLVHQMRSRMIPNRAGAQPDIDGSFDMISHGQGARLEFSMMAKHARLNFLRILDNELAGRCG